MDSLNFFHYRVVNKGPKELAYVLKVIADNDTLFEDLDVSISGTVEQTIILGIQHQLNRLKVFRMAQ